MSTLGRKTVCVHDLEDQALFGPGLARQTARADPSCYHILRLLKLKDPLCPDAPRSALGQRMTKIEGQLANGLTCQNIEQLSTVQATALQSPTGQENVLLMAITLDDGTRIDRPTAEEHKRVQQGRARGSH